MTTTESLLKIVMGRPFLFAFYLGSIERKGWKQLKEVTSVSYLVSNKAYTLISQKES